MTEKVKLDGQSIEFQEACAKAREAIVAVIRDMVKEEGLDANSVLSGAGCACLELAIDMRPEGMPIISAAENYVGMMGCYAIQFVPELRDRLIEGGLPIPDVMGDTPRTVN